MNNAYFRRKPRLLLLLLLIAAASLGVRALIGYGFDKTALLYVGIPFLIALVLIAVRDPAVASTRSRRYRNRLTDAFIIMLGSSVVLFEGFLCVVMFMPIYLTVIGIMFLIDVYQDRNRHRQGKRLVSLSILPVIVLLSAFEGISPSLSFDRDETVSVSRELPLSVSQIKQNLQQPMALQKSRPWFLTLFPMPDRIVAGSLEAGDVHEIHFKYFRWFVANLHEGRMLLEISEVGENHVRTTFLEDSSYIANYLKLHGTQIEMVPISPERTRVTLHIRYARSLDPYWYFSPLMQFGVGQTAEYLISEVMLREQSDA